MSGESIKICMQSFFLLCGSREIKIKCKNKKILIKEFKIDLYKKYRQRQEELIFII